MLSFVWLFIFFYSLGKEVNLQYHFKAAQTSFANVYVLLFIIS